MSSGIDQLKLLQEHANFEKQLREFTKEELEKFPLEYLIEKCYPLELLYAWHNLPFEYQHNPFLQVCLPCFIHYNSSYNGNIDHIDSPPPSQKKCHSCKKAFQ